MPSPFHRWLLKHRPYCEICTGPYPSTRIIDIQGHNKAVCDAHFQSHHPLRAGYEKRQQQAWPPVEYYIDRWKHLPQFSNEEPKP